MDPRVQKHAQILVAYCTEVKPGEHVGISARPRRTPAP